MMALIQRSFFAILRYDSVTGWHVQKDAGHEPCGISGVGVVGGMLRIYLDFASEKVGVWSLIPDDCLAKYGYRSNTGQMGTECADLSLPREIDIEGFVYWNGSAFVMDSANPCQPCTVENVTPAGGPVTARIHHDAIKRSTMVPMINMLEGGWSAVRCSGWNATSFDVVMPQPTYDTGCKFSFTRKGSDEAFVENGYANPDGNLGVSGFAWVK